MGLAAEWFLRVLVDEVPCTGLRPRVEVLYSLASYSPGGFYRAYPGLLYVREERKEGPYQVDQGSRCSRGRNVQ
jgi:hypothetical protein